MPFRRTALLIVLGTLLRPLPSPAVDLQGLEFTGSGFMTLAAGRVFGGTRDVAVDQGFHCPCFISDYAQRGVYEAGAAPRGWTGPPAHRTCFARSAT